MADFSTIKGFNVQVLSADPPAPGEGQVWYNTTTGTLKGYGQIGTGAWSAGGTVPASYYGGSYSGTQTAGIVAGGAPGGAVEAYDYNGSAWTEAGDLNQGRTYTVPTGIGTQTSAQVMGGEEGYLNDTEQYNGTAWTQVNDMANSFQSRGGSGTQTAALATCGVPGYSALVESWDGTNWSTGTAAPFAQGYGAGGGTQTSALIAGSSPGIGTADTWNGSAWTEITSLNSGRHNMSRAITSDSSALIAAGEPQPAGRGVLTEIWDGSTWTEAGDLATAGNKRPGNGTTMAAIVAGNEAPNNGASEEWTVPTTTKTFTAS
mgnify:CR=1 FL=1